MTTTQIDEDIMDLEKLIADRETFPAQDEPLPYYGNNQEWSPQADLRYQIDPELPEGFNLPGENLRQEQANQIAMIDSDLLQLQQISQAEGVYKEDPNNGISASWLKGPRGGEDQALYDNSDIQNNNQNGNCSGYSHASDLPLEEPDHRQETSDELKNLDTLEANILEQNKEALYKLKIGQDEQCLKILKKCEGILVRKLKESGSEKAVLKLIAVTLNNLACYCKKYA